MAAGGIKVNTRLDPTPNHAADATKQPARHTPEGTLLANPLSSDVVSQQRTTPLHGSLDEGPPLRTLLATRGFGTPCLLHLTFGRSFLS